METIEQNSRVQTGLDGMFQRSSRNELRYGDSSLDSVRQAIKIWEGSFGVLRESKNSTCVQEIIRMHLNSWAERGGSIAPGDPSQMATNMLGVISAAKWRDNAWSFNSLLWKLGANRPHCRFLQNKKEVGS